MSSELEYRNIRQNIDRKVSRLAWWAIVAVVGCTIPFIAASVFAAPSGVTVKTEYVGDDSVRLVARWAAVKDNKGAADSYRVLWQSGSTMRNTVRLVPNDTFYMLRPPVGDSSRVTISVTAVRRGIASPQPALAGLWVKNPDAPPPNVDSLRLDTLTVDITSTVGVGTEQYETKVAAGVIPFDTTKMWMASVLHRQEDSLRALGIDTTVSVEMAVGGVMDHCVFLRNDARREFYPVMHYTMTVSDTTVVAFRSSAQGQGTYIAQFISPECNTEGWMARLYGQYYAGYTMREIPAQVDGRDYVREAVREAQRIARSRQSWVAVDSHGEVVASR